MDDPASQAKDIGLTIKRARERRGMTQRELSDAINVSLGTISRWERGLHLERSYVRNMRRLAETLDVDFGELRALKDADYEERIQLAERRIEAIMRWIRDHHPNGNGADLDDLLADQLESGLRHAPMPAPAAAPTARAAARKSQAR